MASRVPPVVVTVGMAFLMFLVSRLTRPLPIAPLFRYGLAIVLASLGAVLAILAVCEFGKAQTSVNPLDLNRTRALVIEGVFRLSRNPMYVAMLLFLIAVGCMMASPLAIAVAFLFVPLITRLQILPEERVLAERFGPDYIAYCREVRRWL